ncbi:hypothetical protein Trydic_g11068 [Trypoxylus dichotomus]
MRKASKARSFDGDSFSDTVAWKEKWNKNVLARYLRMPCTKDKPPGFELPRKACYARVGSEHCFSMSESVKQLRHQDFDFLELTRSATENHPRQDEDQLEQQARISWDDTR